MTSPVLNDGESYVEGRLPETAARLLEAAAKHGAESRVITTSFGYIVPTFILEQDEDGDVDDEDLGGAVEFDPSAATIDEVKDYLDGADGTERERVLAAEADGKKRKGILDLAATSEGEK